MKLIKFLVLFITGFCIYITIEVCFRGYSYPLMGVCGGLALILNDKINDKISWNVDILLQGAIGSIIITLFELVIGTVAKFGLIQIMWDYSNVPLNYNGVICVPFSLLWALLSIVGVFISDAINYYLFEEEPLPYYKLFGRTIIQFKERGCVKHDTNN